LAGLPAAAEVGIDALNNKPTGHIQQPEDEVRSGFRQQAGRTV